MLLALLGRELGHRRDLLRAGLRQVRLPEECAEGAASAALGAGGQHSGPPAVAWVSEQPPLALHYSSILLRPIHAGSREPDGSHPAKVAWK
jgi:hypothetical protein